MTAIVQRTARAVAAEELTAQDYRDIYTEVRSKMSLRAFVALVESAYTIGYWSKYENTPDMALSRTALNELRRAVSLPALPPTIADATADADPDAAVYQIGAQAASRVLLVGADVREITLHVNGSPSEVAAPPANAMYRPIHAPSRAAARASIVVGRDTWNRLNSARVAAGQTWEQFVARLLGEDA